MYGLNPCYRLLSDCKLHSAGEEANGNRDSLCGMTFRHMLLSGSAQQHLASNTPLLSSSVQETFMIDYMVRE
jgi:hypothetical protein